MSDVYTPHENVAETIQLDPMNAFWRMVYKYGSIPVNKPCVGNCWIWLGNVNNNGYGYLTIGDRTQRAHRVVYELVLGGPIPKDKQINHRCDNKICVRPTHLQLGTQAENIQEAVDRGLYPSGEAHYRAKLTEQDVVAIRRDYIPGKIGYMTLAQRYSVSQDTIKDVVFGYTWRKTGGTIRIRHSKRPYNALANTTLDQSQYGTFSDMWELIR